MSPQIEGNFHTESGIISTGTCLMTICTENMNKLNGDGHVAPTASHYGARNVFRRLCKMPGMLCDSISDL